MKKIMIFITLAASINVLYAQWQQTSLDSVGVSSFTSSGNNLFAGTGCGVYISSDTGSTWTSVSNGLTTLVVRAMASIGTTIFAGTEGGGMFRSDNNGANWTEINTGLAETYILSLGVKGTDLFAGGWTSAYLSSDSGATWTEVGNALPDTMVCGFATCGTDIYAALGYSLIYKSSNNGSSWTRTSDGLPSMNPVVFGFAVNGTKIFAATENGFYYSENSPVNWTPVSDNPSWLFPLYAVAISGSFVYGGGAGGVFLTTNFGLDTTYNIGLTSYGIFAITVFGDYLFASANGVMRIPLSVANGINEVHSLYHLRAYPNPAENWITIEIPWPAKIEIVNVEGQIVKTIAAGSLMNRIDISDLSIGCYIVRAASDQGTIVQRFVKY